MGEVKNLWLDIMTGTHKCTRKVIILQKSKSVYNIYLVVFYIPNWTRMTVCRNKNIVVPEDIILYFHKTDRHRLYINK